MCNRCNIRRNLSINNDNIDFYVWRCKTCGSKESKGFISMFIKFKMNKETIILTNWKFVFNINQENIEYDLSKNSKIVSKWVRNIFKYVCYDETVFVIT